MAIEVRGIAVDRPGTVKRVMIITRNNSASVYKQLVWPVGKPLTPGTIKVEVAKLWKVEPTSVVILENVEIPKI